MIRVILVCGTIGGLIVAVPMVATMLTMSEGPPGSAAFYGYLSIILGLTAVFLGIKHHRDKALGGVIRFVPALMVGLGISAIASLFWVIGWEISLSFSGFDFPAAYSQSMLEAARARGASQAELQQIIADSANFARRYANPLFRIPITFVEMFPIGVLVSVISAALLRNSRFLPARRNAAPREPSSTPR
jgi:hypothetical protein